MRSRTGYATAKRTSAGIEVHCVPFASLVAAGALSKVPIVRGIVGFLEMAAMAVGVANGGAPRSLAGEWRDPAARRLLVRLGGVASAGVVLPVVGAMAGIALIDRSWVTNECDHPALFAMIAAGLRYAALLAFGVILRSADPALLRHHGAEHRAVAVLEAGREVTVSRAQHASILHRRCGTMLYAYGILVMALLEGLALHAYGSRWGGFPAWPWPARLPVLAGTSLIMAVVGTGVAVELLRAAAIIPGAVILKPWEWPGMLFQRLTVSRPTDAEVEVAIVALEAALSIAPSETAIRTHLVPGLVDDESAPGFQRPRLARPAPAGGGSPRLV